MSYFPDSHSFLGPFSSVLEQSFCALRTLILILEISCSFCKTLLNIWILYTEILSNAFKTCYFPQIHSVKCCHPLFIIPGIVSIILYGLVALCLFWTLSITWFPFMSALCFAKVGRGLLFPAFWDKIVISRYSAVNSPQMRRNMDTTVLPINSPSFCRSLKFYCPAFYIH